MSAEEVSPLVALPPFGKINFWKYLAGFLGLFLLAALVVIALLVKQKQPISKEKEPEKFVASTTPPPPNLSRETADWLVYENSRFGVSFRYPPDLVVETEKAPGYALLEVSFVGRECQSIPPEERGHVPEVTFTISWPTNIPRTSPVCDQDVGPNCRTYALAGPIPLSDGLEAMLTQNFGVSGDSTNLEIRYQDLLYTLSSGSGPVPCGDRYDYTSEIFQMARSFSVKSQASQIGKIMTEASTWENYRNEEYGFSMQYPEIWKLSVEEYEGGRKMGNVIRLNWEANSNFIISLEVDLRPLDLVISHIAPDSQKTIDGQLWYYTKVKLPPDEGKTSKWLYAAGGSGKTTPVFTVSHPSSEEELANQVIEQVLSKFKFIPEHD